MPKKIKTMLVIFYALNLLIAVSVKKERYEAPADAGSHTQDALQEITPITPLKEPESRFTAIPLKLTITTEKPTEQPTEPPTTPPETEPPYIHSDISLSKELQEYTFNQCDGNEQLYFLAMAVMYQESRYIADSISTDGHDFGLMQVRDCNLPDLVELFGEVDLLDPYDNIKCGVSILKGHYEKYGEINLALMCYNCGEAGAKRLWEQGKWETDYSIKVTKYYNNLTAGKELEP